MRPRLFGPRKMKIIRLLLAGLLSFNEAAAVWAAEVAQVREIIDGYKALQ